MNYTQLYNAILDYIEAGGSEFIANIPNFVKSAEQKIYNLVQLPAFRKNVTGSITSGNKYLSVPSDFMAVHSLAVIGNDVNDTYYYLLNKDVSFIREAFPYPATSGRPTHYALFNEAAFILGPTPDATYDTELHYFYYPESIVTASTTWLGDKFSNVLLYGSLVEANMFVKGEADMTATYEKQFNEALDSLKVLGDGKNRQDSYRSGQTRINVP